MRRMRAPIGSIFASALLALAACEGTDAARPGPGAEPTGCAAPGDCAAGLRCHRGACIGDEAPPYTVDLRVIPLATGEAAPVEVHGATFDGPVLEPDHPIVVPRGVTVVRSVVTPDGTAIAGTVTAWAEDARVLPPLSVSAGTSETADGPRFTLDLAPTWPTLARSLQCVTYAVRVVPDARHELPPFERSGVRIGPCGPAPDLELPAAARDLHRIAGEVLVSPDNPTPIPAQVFARDERRRPVSTKAATDSSGAFTLALWPSDAERTVTLRVEGVDARQTPLPRVDVDLVVPPTGAVGGPVVHRIYLGDVGRTFVVRGRVVGIRGADEVPVAGARVRLRGEVGNGTYETSAQTGPDGLFDVTVYPAEYVIDVDPRESDFRLLRVRQTLAPDGPPLELTVRPRTPVTGRVLDPAGAPVAGAVVESRLMRARYADPQLEGRDEEPPARTAQATTDADGYFTLRLDPGDHLISVEAPLRQGLPCYAVRRTVPADQPVDLGRLEIPPAGAVAVTLVTEDGAPVTDARVEAWARRPDADPFLVGQATTDAAGAATVIVPATAPP